MCGTVKGVPFIKVSLFHGCTAWGWVHSVLSHSLRAGDWLFSSDAGLCGLAEQSGCKRLVVVAMHCGH